MPTIWAELAKDTRAPLKTGEALESPSLEVFKRRGHGPKGFGWVVGLNRSAWWLNFMILKVFSSPHGSMILWSTQAWSKQSRASPRFIDFGGMEEAVEHNICTCQYPAYLYQGSRAQQVCLRLLVTWVGTAAASALIVSHCICRTAQAWMMQLLTPRREPQWGRTGMCTLGRSRGGSISELRKEGSMRTSNELALLKKKGAAFSGCSSAVILIHIYM